MDTIDFDAFRAEQKQETFKLKIGGVEYPLPSSMPASLAVDLIHMKTQLDDTDEVPLDRLDDVGRAIFGQELWRTLLDEHRIKADELGPLIEMVLGAYAPKQDPPQAST